MLCGNYVMLSPGTGDIHKMRKTKLTHVTKAAPFRRNPQSNTTCIIFNRCICEILPKLRPREVFVKTNGSAIFGATFNLVIRIGLRL